MTIEEMQKIAMIISTADNGCSTCVGKLIDEVNKAFPEFELTWSSAEWSRRPEWADDDDEAKESFQVIIARLIG